MGLGVTNKLGPNQWMREGHRKLAAMKQQLTLIKIDRFHSLFSCFILVIKGVSIPRHCYNTQQVQWCGEMLSQYRHHEFG